MKCIRKYTHAGNLGVPVEFWKIRGVRADFTSKTLLVELHGWSDAALMEQEFNPLFVLTMEFSPDMVQRWRKDFIATDTSGELPDFSALSFDADVTELTHEYLIHKVLNHPSFADAEYREEETIEQHHS